jgi:hypothetical protein
MFEPIKEGVLGFFLVVGLWLSPGKKAELSVPVVRPAESGYVLQCVLDIAWNSEMGKVVDAGIPLRFKMSMYPDRGDTVAFIRSLRFDLADYSYTFTDSSIQNYADSLYRSKAYPQVLVALRDYTRWTFQAQRPLEECRVEVELLRSRAPRLNRTVDMSLIWGQRRLSTVVKFDK